MGFAFWAWWLPLGLRQGLHPEDNVFSSARDGVDCDLFDRFSDFGRLLLYDARVLMIPSPEVGIVLAGLVRSG